MSRPRRSVWLIALFWLIGASVGAEENEQKSPGSGWYVNADVYGLYNPHGVLITSELTYNIPYQMKHEMVWSHVELGYHLSGTAVHSTYGVHLEWMPWAFLRLRANYDLRWFHGTMGSLLEFSSADVPHDESDVYDYGTEKMALGHRFWFAPTLQLYVKGVALVNQTYLKWYFIDSEMPYFFNWEYSTVSERNDFLVDTTTLLMYNFLKKRSPRSLFVGGMYQVVWQPSTAFRRQSVAGIIVVEPLKSPCRIGVPHILLAVGVYAEETYRTNEPFILLDVGTTYDFRKRPTENQ